MSGHVSGLSQISTASDPALVRVIEDPKNSMLVAPEVKINQGNQPPDGPGHNNSDPNDHGQPPNMQYQGNGTKQIQFQNNIQIMVNSSGNISLNVNFEETLADRSLGLTVLNQEQVNISLTAQATFSNPPGKTISKKATPQSGSQGLLILHPNYHLTLATTEPSPILATESFSSVLFYDTYLILSFEGELNAIEIYSQLNATLGLQNIPLESVAWAVYDNSTQSWHLAETSLVEDRVIIAVDGGQLVDNQLILTLVSIEKIEAPSFWTQPWMIAVYGLLAFAIIFGSLMTQEEYRDFLLNRVLHINPSPHRLNMEQVLENENRAAIISTILEDPGVHFNELLRVTSMSAGTLAWHLDILETFKVVRKQRVGQYLTYYPYHDNNPLANLDPLLQKSRTTLEILQMINDHPGLYQNQIAKRMDFDHKTVKYHLDKLIEAEAIYFEQRGRRRHFFPRTIPKSTRTQL